MNKCMLIGNLCAAPEKRVTQSGASLVNINLATNKKYTDKQGQKQSKVEYHRLVFWDKKAELLEQYCDKGSKLYVEGEIQTREWQDKEGQKRFTTEIQVFQMEFLDSKPQGNPQQGGYQQNAPQQGGYQQNATQGGQAANDFVGDDNIPY